MSQQHRSTTSQIWRTVVFAGAMLGTSACGGKSTSSTTPEASPAPEAAPPATTPAVDPANETVQTPDPCAGGSDPCGGETATPAPAPEPEPRPRTPANPRPKGRGFILA